MKTKTTIGMTHYEWLKKRQFGIGGSDVAAILGMNPYKTPFDVWIDKTGSEPIEIPDNPRMRAGRMLEPVIAELYTQETGNKVQYDNKVRVHKEYPFLLANIDRSILSNNGRGTGVLEIKATSKYAFEQWEDEGLPKPTYLQIQHYLSITGRKWGDVAVLIDGYDIRIIPVEYDSETIKLMTAQLISFWRNNVLKIIPPEPINEEDIKKMYPNPTSGKTIKAALETYEIIQELRILKDKIKPLEKEKKKLSEQVKLMMTDAEILNFGGEIIATWKQSKSSEKFNTTQFRIEHPDLYKKYLAEVLGNRRFLIK